MTNKMDYLNGRHYVAGHRGMVGAALHRALINRGATQLSTRTSAQLDLRDAAAVRLFFETERPDYVYLAAAKVGGIWANMSYPASFIFDNLQIQSNVIEAAREFGVRKLLFLGSSCIYPKLAPQPLKEEYLMAGPLEPSNEPYAMAKLAGMSLIRAYRKQYGCDYISVLPCNLYGPGDNYHPQQSHVMAALLRKFTEAVQQGRTEVEVWGSGSPLREFMHCDDLASACLFLMENYSAEAPFFRVFLHLSKTGSPAPKRGISNGGPLGAQQRTLCHGQVGRDVLNPGLPKAVRLRFYIGFALQFIWAWRQLPSSAIACDGSPFAQIHRSSTARPNRSGGLGQWKPP